MGVWLQGSGHERPHKGENVRYHIHVYSDTSLNQPTMEQILNGPLRGRGVRASLPCAIVWHLNKAIHIGEVSICGDGQLERVYCIE